MTGKSGVKPPPAPSENGGGGAVSNNKLTSSDLEVRKDIYSGAAMRQASACGHTCH